MGNDNISTNRKKKTIKGSVAKLSQFMVNISMWEPINSMVNYSDSNRKV